MVICAAVLVVVTDTRGRTSSGQYHPYADGIAGISVWRGIGSLGRPRPSDRGSAAVSPRAVSRPPRRRFKRVRASWPRPPAPPTVRSSSRSTSSGRLSGGTPFLLQRRGFCCGRYGTASSPAEDARTKHFASALERRSARGPLIGAEISDSSRGPRGSAAPCAYNSAGSVPVPVRADLSGLRRLGYWTKMKRMLKCVSVGYENLTRLLSYGEPRLPWPLGWTANSGGQKP